MRYLLFILITLISNVVLGQKTPKLPVFINECVTKGVSGDAYLSTKKNFAHFYAIALCFNAEGKIDTLHYSTKLNPETKRLYGLDHSLLKRIKTYNFKFKEYASKVVLIPFYYYNVTDNSVDYKNGLLNSMANLLPEAVYGKPVIVLKPVVDANLPVQH